MSHSDIIHEILELNDKNIIIENYFTKKHLRNGNTIKVFSGKLINKPIVCPKCGHIDDNSIIAYGFTKSSRVIIPQISRYSAILSLKKQRLLCKHCNSTFVSETKILDRNCYISNITKRAIAIDGSKKSSEKDIARSNDVSHSTVNRILSRFEAYSEPSIDYLPEHLSFDEFKSVKNSAGAMSFIYTDALTGDIIDILEDRRLPKLIKYFNRFPKAVRHNVKSIIIDIYSPYISLIKQLFPKSKIILDKFHVVQLFSRALNKTRLNLMNRFDKTSLEYKILKKHWKLILKNHENIEQSQHFYHYNFRKPMREVDILNYMLNLNINLKKSYELFQDFRTYIKHKNVNAVKSLLESKNENISHHMKTSVETCSKYWKYIENTITSGLSNGKLEGINNLIKTIKRIAFGYRNFYNFRNRIILIRNSR